MTRALRGAILPVLLVILWAGTGAAGLTDPRIIPSPWQVLEAAWDQIAHQGLLHHLAASLARDMAGFIIGSALGLVVGTLMGLSRLADRLVMPTFHGLRQIAILAWIPLISIWFGVGEAAKVVFILVAAFIPVVLNTYEGVRGASTSLIEVAHVLTLTRWQLLTRLYLPSALPSIATGIHLALIYAWVASIGSEYFMTVGPGIGGLIISGREQFRMDLVVLGIMILGIVGYAINRLASMLEGRLLRWRVA